MGLQVVESGGKNIEVAVLRHQQPLEFLSDDFLEGMVKTIEAEKEAAKAEEKARRQAAGAAAAGGGGGAAAVAAP